MVRFSLGLLIVAVLMATVPARNTPLAIVVHPSLAIEDISLEELRRLYLGQTRTWTADGSVRLFELASQRGAFYRALLNMPESQVDRHWIGLVFRGEGADPPVRVEGAVTLAGRVSATPGAVAFLPLDSIPAGLKILTIEGARAGDPSYPIN